EQASRPNACSLKLNLRNLCINATRQEAGRNEYVMNGTRVLRAAPAGDRSRLYRQRLQGLSQPPLELRPVSAAEGKLGPILEYDHVVTMGPRLQLEYSLRINNGGAMDTHELLGVKPLDELPYSGPIQVCLWPNV